MNSSLWIVAGLLSGLMVWTAPAHGAALANGGFETGDLDGWAAVGDALVVDVSSGPPSAHPVFQVLISNAPSPPTLFNPPNAASFSGTDAVAATALEAFLELPFPGLGNVPEQQPAFEGSGIAQSFTARAGDVLSFHWNYLTDERVFGPPQPGGVDFSFVVLDGTVTVLGDAASALVESPTIFLEETGFRRFEIVIATTGLHTLGFGIVDTADTQVNSALLVDRVSVTRPVRIEISPGNASNPVNLKSNGELRVAILGSRALDVTLIDPDTVQLDGVSVARRGSHKAPKLAVSIKDVNRDGRPDLVAFFAIEDLVDAGALDRTTTELSLTATMEDGTQIQGRDSVRIATTKHRRDD